MQILVLGMDPSLRNWGLAQAVLDLDTGDLGDPILDVIKTAEEPKGKQVRQNSYDLEAAEQLALQVIPYAKRAKVIFVEVPHGSQSAAAMKGYGICIGILGCIRSMGIPIVEVSENESKTTFVGVRTATKKQMIDTARALYPNSNWPVRNKQIVEGKAEHMADAIAAIHAGVKTPMFQNLMRLFAGVNV